MSGGVLKVANGTNRDAYVKLINPDSHESIAEFYVKSNSVYTLEQIPDGTYQVLFELGTGWNAQTQDFSQNKSFSKFNESLKFTTRQLGNEIQYRVFEITLHPVPNGKARTSAVSRQEISRY